MAQAESLIGKTYGRLMVVARSSRTGGTRPRVYWDCVCACGKTAVVEASNLRGGAVQSCGCLRNERVAQAVGKHAHTGSPEYVAWQHMKSRCYNAANPDYPNWGGRGIRVCDRWRDSFEAFLADMGPRPTGATIERRDNDSDYEPGNCVWASRQAQARNTRRNRRLTIAGTTRTLAEWCQLAGLSEATVRKRLNRGWDAGLSLGLSEAAIASENGHAA